MLVVVRHQVGRAPGIDTFRHQLGLCFTGSVPSAVKDIDRPGDHPGSNVGRHDNFRLVVKDSDRIVIFNPPRLRVNDTKPNRVSVAILV